MGGRAFLKASRYLPTWSQKGIIRGVRVIKEKKLNKGEGEGKSLERNFSLFGKEKKKPSKHKSSTKDHKVERKPNQTVMHTRKGLSGLRDCTLPITIPADNTKNSYCSPEVPFTPLSCLP